MIETNYKFNPDLDIHDLVEKLAKHSGPECQRFRMQLVELGAPAVPVLIKALQSNDSHLRWEVVQVLSRIEEPEAAPQLVKALEDENINVRWAAMEGLIDLDRSCLAPLFKALTKHFYSVWLREGAHHILHQLKIRGRLLPTEIRVFEALEGPAAEMDVPWAAEAALNSLKKMGLSDGSK
jgi:HEAT repeat protein